MGVTINNGQKHAKKDMLTQTDQLRRVSNIGELKTGKMKLFGLFCVVFAVYFAKNVSGHGYMITPVNRASLWRVDWKQPPNYNDNEYFCGGVHAQYYVNGGRCGPCGDDWREPVPRSNENGGVYGNGVVLSNYTAGTVLTVKSILTANHLGSIYFHICELKNPTQPETEECFQPVYLADGTSHYSLHPTDYIFNTKIKLPEGLTCERCVLRWHYRTGNSWGMCEDGTQNMGCGNQEIFRSCADIRILAGDGASNEAPSDSGENEGSDDEDESSEGADAEDANESKPCFLPPQNLRK
ncbi:hypothetical protein HUJ04_005394 [Dendroctonus ponderosae]|nr:hypothetical protein HUJ04_005394 [Dendroctonus ponderosae]KAH0999537.1 hypothetical protein HUJ04_005394 [Dendroctonus ponderosae]